MKDLIRTAWNAALDNLVEDSRGMLVYTEPNHLDNSYMMRLDYEDEEDVVDYRDKMTEVAVKDLEDLLINGDSQNTTVPVLKVLDGEVKRRQKLVCVSFPSMTLVKEHKLRKKTIEYTVYFRIAPVFK